jgi:hypothetical protein
MKFKLDQSVMYKGEHAVIWDYSHRYGEYEIIQGEEKIRQVNENELSEYRQPKIRKEAKQILKAIIADADRRRSYYTILNTWWPFGGNPAQRVADRMGCDDELWKHVRELHQRYEKFCYYVTEIKPEWKEVERIYYADNSTEAIQENNKGERRQVMIEAPHGDACY